METRKLKDIPYKVSEYGDITRTEVSTGNGRGGKPLKHRILKSGYHRVLLCYEGKQIDKYVHRLVAELFVNNPRGFNEVNHRDGDKSNNHYSNLEWVSHQWNHQHAAMNNMTNPDRLLNEEAVKVIKWFLKYRPEVQHKELAEKYGVSRGTITDINVGRSWRYVSV